MYSTLYSTVYTVYYVYTPCSPQSARLSNTKQRLRFYDVLYTVQILIHKVKFRHGDQEHYTVLTLTHMKGDTGMVTMNSTHYSP